MRVAPFAEFRPEVRTALRWLVVFRFISNTAIRLPFTFLPALARGVGLSVPTLGLVLSARDLTALGTPFIGRAADRRGTTVIMAVTSVVLTIGLFISVLGPIGFMIGLIVVGTGKLFFDVAMSAWVGESVAYERRGRAIGLIEMSWAASALIGLPVVGLLLDYIGWWAAPLALGVISVPVTAAIVGRATAEDRTTRTHGRPRAPRVTRRVLATLVAFGLIAMSSQFLLVGHGLWLDQTYGFDPTRIGLAAFGIGVMEAVASATSSVITDRIGKTVSVIAGMTLLTVAMSVLALVPAPMVGIGLALLGLAFLGFEFGLVASFSLISELDPGARAQMVGWALGLSTAVRAIVSLVGTALYDRQGFAPLMGIGALAGAACVAVLLATLHLSDSPILTKSEERK